MTAAVAGMFASVDQFEQGCLLDTSDVAHSIVAHMLGEAYMARECSVWRGGECIGSALTAFWPFSDRVGEDGYLDEDGAVREDWVSVVDTILSNQSVADIEEMVAWALEQEWRVIAMRP